MFCEVEERRALVVLQERVREAKIEIVETEGRMSAIIVVSLSLSELEVEGGGVEVLGREGAIMGDWMVRSLVRGR